MNLKIDDAPLNLIYVADLSRISRGTSEEKDFTRPFYQLFKVNGYAKLDPDEDDLSLTRDHWNCSPISL